MRIAPVTARGEIGLALVSDARIRFLNKQYRRKDCATDVLSFEPTDIMIAKGVARRQAREAGHSYATELRVLALHGLLHLLGYDHHDPADGGRMARVERALRRKGGLRAGLIERAKSNDVRRERAHRSEPRKRSEPAKRRGREPRASGRAKRPGGTARVERAPHANGAGDGVPASERVGGSGGAKPPGK